MRQVRKMNLFRTLPKWRLTLLKPRWKPREGLRVKRKPKAPSLRQLMVQGIIQEFHHPQNYDSIHPIVSMPHILNVGLPPMLNTNEFSNWKFEMESHISCSCTALWRSVVHGFHPHDASNLAPIEDIESQLNKTALNIIQKALPQEHVTHIRACKTA